MNEENNFPKLDGGWCDGLGCGNMFCYCKHWLEAREEFQRVYNKPWDKNDPDCKMWEAAWRLAYEQSGKYYKKELKSQKQFMETKIAIEKKDCQKRLDDQKERLKR